jgi:hypothetical protein
LKDGKWDKAIEVVSSNRRLSGHKARPKAVKYSAHEQFEKDLELVADGMKELLSVLESSSGLDAEKCLTVIGQKKHSPKLAGKQLPNYPTAEAIAKMIGKTVSSVEYGYEEKSKGSHLSEIIILHYTDGSSVAIDTCTNAGHFVSKIFKPEDFNAGFFVKWIDSVN